mmetsp:Transcript_69817/g.176549  ORF Transcript_69817/g.176549 Transcript_69817/m.176549 type:complete len:506 (-) Transcript_69817:304-1821(-)
MGSALCREEDPTWTYGPLPQPRTRASPRELQSSASETPLRRNLAVNTTREANLRENLLRYIHVRDMQNIKVTCAFVFACLMFTLAGVDWYRREDRRRDWHKCLPTASYCLEELGLTLATHGALLLFWGLDGLVNGSVGDAACHTKARYDSILPRESLMVILSGEKDMTIDIDDVLEEGTESRLTLLLVDAFPFKFIDAQLMFLVCRVFVNLSCVLHNYGWRLQEGRNFDMDLNFSKFIVACIEVYYVLWNVAACAWACYWGRSSSTPVKVIADRLHLAASFSCLQVLPRLDVMEVFNSVSRHSFIPRIVMLAKLTFFGSAAVLSLVIKAESVALFRKGNQDAGKFNWDAAECIKVLFFVNQVAGLFNKQRYAIRTTLLAMGEAPAAWLEVLAEHLKHNAMKINEYKHQQFPAWWRAVAYYSNLTYKQVSEIHKLDKKTSKSQGSLPCDSELRNKFEEACTAVKREDLAKLRQENASHIALICGPDVEHVGEFEFLPDDVGLELRR